MIEAAKRAIVNYLPFTIVIRAKLVGFWMLYFATFPDEWNATEIVPGVFVGDIYAAYDKEKLQKHNITHIITAIYGADPPFPNEFTYMNVPLNDIPEQSIAESLEDTINFIDSALNDGGKVLVHCMRGVSRSGSLMVAYLMKKRELTFEAALECARQERMIIRPNEGFAFQLKEFERKIFHTTYENLCDGGT